jgi:ankyrin repeat protein
MRLLHVHVDGTFSLVERTGTLVPPYAILSHTWGSSKDEVTYHDLCTNTGKEKIGYSKLVFCAQQAVKDDLQYFWVDTCCIDKSSSAELAEAITSMFRWYNVSNRCYVYLTDVSTGKRKADYKDYDSAWESAFRTSKWFTRGWTLQELLAPRIVQFFSKEGKLLGDKLGLEQQIHEITHIPIRALRGAPMKEFSIDERMSWIENRQTTREEDRAYSLLGMFGVSMAPLYGEREEVAFRRLQREINDTTVTRDMPLDDEQKQIFTDSLRFEQIDARYLTIKNAHAKTCKWLLNTSSYNDWLDLTKVKDHQGFLWIKGKPGTGKSTLMKFALATARKTMKDTVVIAYFFNARGEHLEKSTVGTYRSLLVQLLEQLPKLHDVLESCTLSARSIGAGHQWSDEALESLLEQAIQGLGGSHVVCFIDALDECEERQIRSMMSFFERVGQLTVSSGIRFQICFSSRHYPEITIKKGISMVLEEQEGHTQDITNYLESELKIGKSKVAQKIRTDLQDKASGVFMWVILVVNILNQEFDRGRMHSLKRRLQEIPSDLHKLFCDILTRDSRNKEELILCIQWVLFAKEPMSPEQLYFAILSGVEPDAVTRWDPEETTKDAMRRFLLDSSKGLTEITKSKAQKVQFIHESVRDFLLKDDSLGSIWTDLKHNFEGQSHERLRRCCSNYIGLEIEGVLSIPEDIFEASPQRITEVQSSVLDAFPFLEYAVHNVLHHADAAEKFGLNQNEVMLDFPRTRWIWLDNLLKKHKIRRHTNEMSMLYLLAECNLANLIKARHSVRSCFTIEAERYGSPFFAAMAIGSKEAVCVFVDALQMSESQKGRVQETYMQYCQDSTGRDILGRDYTFPRHQGRVRGLLNLESPDVLALALKAKMIGVNTRTRDGLTPLMFAAETGNRRMAEILIGMDKIELEAVDDNGETALLKAVQNGHKDIAELLISTGKAEINVTDMSELLLWAAKNGHKDIVKLLLDICNPEVNAQDRFGLTSLVLAARLNHMDVVELLLSTGKVEVNAKDRYGSTALMNALERGHVNVVQLLLDTGKVEVNARDQRGSTALMKAADQRHVNVVKRLLSVGKVEVNAKDRYGSTALMKAAERGYGNVAKLLLDTGMVEVDAKDSVGSTAFMKAASRGRLNMVKLLLNTGKIEVEAKNNKGATALMLAEKSIEMYGGSNDLHKIVGLLESYVHQD